MKKSFLSKITRIFDEKYSKDAEENERPNISKESAKLRMLEIDIQIKKNELNRCYLKLGESFYKKTQSNGSKLSLSSFDSIVKKIERIKNEIENKKAMRHLSLGQEKELQPLPKKRSNTKQKTVAKKVVKSPPSTKKSPSKKKASSTKKRVTKKTTSKR